jgi:hypothetical protein
MLKKRRTSGQKTELTVEIDVLWVISVLLSVLMCVFSFFSVMRIISGFFGASHFEIKGECEIYGTGDLMAGAGLKRGDRLYRMDVSATEEKLMKNCAYLKDVDIKRVFPNKIVFEVECHKPVWYIEISGDFYVLDAELNVLEETSGERVLREDMDLIKLTLPRVKSAIVDGVLTFGDGEEEIKETQKIMETILTSRAFGMISGADIDNRYDIHFEFDKIVQESKEELVELEDVFHISLGGYSKLDVKLEYIVKALLKDDLEGAVGGSIDVSEVGNRVSIRPSFSLDEEEDEITDEETMPDEENTPDTDYDGPVGTPGVAG